jgi:2-iminoacetate synthase
MSTQAQPPLRRFAEFIQRTDDHAAYFVELLTEADRLLGGPEPASAAQRMALAARLERWRYRRLNRSAGQLSAEDRGLVDALDLAANRLAGRSPRLPRWLRSAIADPATDAGSIDEAMAWFDAPAAGPDLIDLATQLTADHFSMPGGHEPQLSQRRILLYAPLYLSNYCVNHCTYCGFRHPNPIQRKHLDLGQALREADVLIGRGFRHILLVAGEYPSLCTTEYYAEIVGAIVDRGVAPAIEIAPQSTDSYAALAAAGACTVTLYQETYHESLYATYHPRGSKAAYDWRLEGLERAAEAGFQRLGLGFLLGLSEPRFDLLALMRHGRYLEDRFPNCRLAFSLPRIHEAPAGFRPPYVVDDATFVRMYCALRIAFPQAELVLSTREAAELRNRLAGICITQLSAGSCTAPGGYEDAERDHLAGQQFPVCDGRSSVEVAEWLRQAGFALTWQVAPIP